MQNKYILLTLVHIIPSIAMDNNQNNNEQSMFPKSWYEDTLGQMVNIYQENPTITDKEFTIYMQDHGTQLINFLTRKAACLAMQELEIDNNNFADENEFTYIPSANWDEQIKMHQKNFQLARLLKNPNIKNCVDQRLNHEKILLTKLKHKEAKRLKQLTKTNASL